MDGDPVNPIRAACPNIACDPGLAAAESRARSSRNLMDDRKNINRRKVLRDIAGAAAAAAVAAPWLRAAAQEDNFLRALIEQN